MLRLTTVPLPLAGFGLELLEIEAGRARLSLDAFMARAVRWWLTEADSSQPSHRVPKFLDHGSERVGTMTVDVEISPDVWSALERTAEEQQASVELLVLHATMCYATHQSSFRGLK
jgi:hypothetical protein